MSKKLFIVDGMAMAFRSFYALDRAGLSGPGGIPIGAVYGTALFLTKLVEEERPDYLVVVSDSKEPTFRHTMFPAYKANRSDMPTDLVAQLPLFFQLIESFGIKLVKVPGVEADDLVATITKRFASEEVHVYIVSGDKDFLQLVNRHVALYSPKKNEPPIITTGDDVRTKLHVTPSQVVDCLALMGDSSDNIPGVKGIGEKGAAKLVAAYGSLEGIYEHIDEISATKTREALLEHRDMAFLSRELVALKSDIPCPLDLNSLKFDLSEHLGSPKALQLLDELNFATLKARIIKIMGTAGYVPRAPTDSPKVESKPSLSHPGPSAEITVKNRAKISFPEPQLINDPDDIDKVLEAILASRSLHFFAHILPKSGESICAPAAELMLMPYEAPQGYNEGRIPLTILDLQNQRHLSKIKALMAHPEATWIGFDLKTQLINMQNSQIEVSCKLKDMMIEDHLIDSNDDRHSFEQVCTKHLQEGTFSPEFLGQISPESRFNRFLSLHYVLDQKIDNLGLAKVAHEIEMPTIQVLAQIERTGVFLDVSGLSSFSDELKVQEQILTKKIHFLAGHEFNIQSPKQLQVVLFDELRLQESLGIKNLKKTKSGYSTDEETLTRLADFEIARELMKYREIAKLKGTYVDTLPQHISPTTGRLHSTFNQTGTATGRLSSENPNLQNIPLRSDLGKRMRAAFCAERPDHLIISADYSQIEIRLLAAFAQSRVLIDAFKQGLDIHSATAASIFKVDPEKVDKELRSRAKAINFGIIYGMGARRLAQETRCSFAEAKAFISQYFVTFPEIKNYLEGLKDTARRLGYSTTITGRRRYMTGLNDSNKAIAARWENIAVNSPIQGSAADLIKLSMIKVNAALKASSYKTKMILQIHDELVFEAPIEECEAAMPFIRATMENAMPLEVPLKVDIHAGKNWLEAHG